MSAEQQVPAKAEAQSDSNSAKDEASQNQKRDAYEDISDAQSDLEPPKSKKSKDSPKSSSDLNNLSTREYLDKTVVPILLDALARLAEDRPADPIDYLTDYLKRHKKNNS